MIRSHSRRSHSIIKSVPKMEKVKKVTRIFNGEEFSFKEGYSSNARRVIKDMHKKKRRQSFKNEIREWL